jgi:hypothetical protein
MTMFLAATADLADLDAISIKLPPELEITNSSDQWAARTVPCADDLAVRGAARLAAASPAQLKAQDES